MKPLSLLRVVAFVVGLVALPCASAFAVDGGTRIHLPEVASVAGGAVALGDIAEIVSDSAATLARVMAVPVGPAPALCESVAVSRDSLQAWLRLREGPQVAAMQWSGAKEVKVSRECERLPESALVGSAKATLEGWLAARPGVSRVAVSVASEPVEVKVPRGQWKLVARPLPPTELARSRMQVWVEVWAGAQFLRVVPVSFSVEGIERVAVATTPLAAGQAIAPQSVEHQTQPLSPRPVAAPPDLAAGRYRVKGALREGEVLSAARVERAPAVARGETARLTSVAGEVRVESKVDVLQDGEPGQWVKVRLPGAGGVVSARVVEAGWVEMKQ